MVLGNKFICRVLKTCMYSYVSNPVSEYQKYWEISLYANRIFLTPSQPVGNANSLEAVGKRGLRKRVCVVLNGISWLCNSPFLLSNQLSDSERILKGICYKSVRFSE